MFLDLKKKKVIVSKTKKIAEKSDSMIVLDINGVSSNTLNSFRKFFRNKGVHIISIRNTLFFRAVSKTRFHCISSFFSGSVLVLLSQGHPIKVMDLLKRFKQSDYFIPVKHIVFESKLLSREEITFFENAPIHQDACVQLVTFLRNLSFIRLIRILKYFYQKLK